MFHPSYFLTITIKPCSANFRIFPYTREHHLVTYPVYWERFPVRLVCFAVAKQVDRGL